MHATMSTARSSLDASAHAGGLTRRQVLVRAATSTVATLGMGGLSSPAVAAQAASGGARVSSGAIGPVGQRGRGGALGGIPEGYRVMGRRHGVAPVVLYAVALQESAMIFGRHVLPWPWTLNVAGQPRRFDSYEASVRGLRTAVASGQPSVDCGLLQVNWRYHHERLGNYWAALDPYPNIGVGASLLRDHFLRTGNWREAVGRYHSEANQTQANAYSRDVFGRIEKLQRSGVAAPEDLHA